MELSLIEFDLAPITPENKALKAHVHAVREVGTIKLKGKSYLQVAYRVYLFRMFNKNGRISTELIRKKQTTDIPYVQCTITGNDGNILGKAIKEVKLNVTKAGPGKDNPYSMAETAAIGRCLNLLGYGTLGGDLEEDIENNLPDAPLNPWG